MLRTRLRQDMHVRILRHCSPQLCPTSIFSISVPHRIPRVNSAEEIVLQVSLEPKR